MSVKNREDIIFDELNAPVPGYSLTDQPNKWPWERPPRDVDPDIVISKIVDKLEKPSVQDRMTRLMLSGATIQELTNTISLAGFSKGEFSVDVAELIKPAIVIYLTKIALDKQIPVKIFNEDDNNREASDKEMLESMKVNNPKVFNAIKEQYLVEKNQPQKTEEKPKGFINMGDE
tara:strand:- start:932 stop:1456 length:525 start_codon:yes stop_codon:yes gene_type:complete